MVVEYAADVTKLTTGITAATDAMTTVGVAAADSSGYLSTLGDQAFTTGVGFDGMAASADTLAVSMADVDASLGVADEALASVAVSADASVASVGAMGTTLAGTSVAAGDAAISFDALSVAEGAAATAGDAIEASLAAVGIALAAVTVAAGIAGVISTKMAGDFEQSMTSLVTGAGEAQSNIKMVSDGILNMAPAVGTSTKQLADGMYMIESAGFHGAAGLDVLKNAAEGAKVGNSDLETTAQAVTGAMINYKDSNLTAAQATNDLIATVGAGQVKLQDLALAMANVEPIAAKSGVSLTDISAAMATMTAKTIPAADAATYLRQTIMAIENPTTKARDEMKSLGLDSADVAEKMKTSLPDALQMITDAAGKKFPVGSAQYIAAIANMVGGTKSMQGIMNLTGSDMATFKKNVEDISGKVKAGGDNISGWAKVQGDFNFKIDQAKANLEQMGIKIGTVALPWLGKLVDGFNSPAFQKFASDTGKTLVKVFDDIGKFVTPLAPKFLEIATNFGKVTDAFKNPAIQKLATEIGGDLKAGLTWLINALASPQFGEFAHIVGVVIAGAILFVIPLIIEITKNIVKFAEDVISRVQPQIEGFMKWWKMAWPGIAEALDGVWKNIKGIVQIAWALISGWIKIGLDILKGDWGAAWNDFKTMLSGVWEGIKTYLHGVWEDIKGIAHIALGGMADKALEDAGKIVKAIGQGILNGFHWVKDAIGTVTQWIADHLPHSPAKIGPLMDLEQSGTEISNQISKGMINGAPLIDSAMNNLAKPVTVGLKGVASTNGVSPLQGGQGDTYIQITMDGQDITNRVMKRVVKDLRGHGLKK